MFHQRSLGLLFDRIVVDAISDPLIGSISDRFRSVWGRRLPFMFASALPIAVSFYFFTNPSKGSPKQVTSSGW